mmetsp:Transcript_39890/g.94775  ORF Transcript_39890/g.94775 Transcript_39890/m.94775 type:complete len:90 (+) Transcript_39890:113-382(+)
MRMDGDGIRRHGHETKGGELSSPKAMGQGVQLSFLPNRLGEKGKEGRTPKGRELQSRDPNSPDASLACRERSICAWDHTRQTHQGTHHC